jgi:4-amino-4-deoxy-L-arabinose transferase-like glycosyltransferase
MNYDEEFTIAFAAPALGPLGLIVQSLSTDCNPPLYYLFAQLSMVIFGATETAIRYPSAVAGVLLIPAMYLVGRQYKDELFGLMLAGFTTVFYNFVFYAKYGRAYAFELLIFAGVFYFFMQANAGNRKAKYLFALCSILAVWTHLFALFPVGVLTLYLMLNEEFALKRFDWVALIVVGASPLLNFVNLIQQGRTITVHCNFGAPLHEILFMIPLDIFTYSAFIITPIVAYMLWKYRENEIYRVIIMTTVVTYVAMVLLSFKTPIILHYAMPLTVMLLLPLIEAFYLAIKKREGLFVYGLIAMVILILEFVQIFALGTIQRGFW